MSHMLVEAMDENVLETPCDRSPLLGFCLALPILPLRAAAFRAATTTNYSEWTYPDGGSSGQKERDWYKDSD